MPLLPPAVPYVSQVEDQTGLQVQQGLPSYSQPFDPSQFALGSTAGGFEQQVAENFSLPASLVVTHVEWQGMIFGGGMQESLSQRNFLVRFFADVAGVPAAAPFFQQTAAAQVTDTGVDSTYSGNAGASIFNYAADINPVQLQPGNVYWLSVLNAVPTPLSQWIWQAGPFVAGGSVVRRDGDTGGWIVETQSVRNSMSFSVPEPGAAGLLLAAAGLPGLARRNRRRTAPGKR